MLLVACGKGNESHTEHDGHQHEEATQQEEIVKPDLSKVKVVNEIDHQYGNRQDQNHHQYSLIAKDTIDNLLIFNS